MTLALFAHLMAAVVMDFREMRISNRLIASGLYWGLAFRIMGEGCAGIVHFLVNISIPVIFLFLFFQLRALGAGDIKLFSVVGAFVTIRQLEYVIVSAFLAACVIGIVKNGTGKRNFGLLCTEKDILTFFSVNFNWIFDYNLEVEHCIRSM